jgi:hypothetical protein
MHAHDDLALHRQLTFMHMQQMPRLPQDVHSVLCRTADECCSVTGRSGETARKCKRRIDHFLRQTIAQFTSVSLCSAEALRQAVSEYAAPGAVAYGFIVQHPFSVCAVQGIKTIELRCSPPPPARLGTRSCFLSGQGGHEYVY